MRNLDSMSDAAVMVAAEIARDAYQRLAVPTEGLRESFSAAFDDIGVQAEERERMSAVRAMLLAL